MGGGIKFRAPTAARTSLQSRGVGGPAHLAAGGTSAVGLRDEYGFGGFSVVVRLVWLQRRQCWLHHGSRRIVKGSPRMYVDHVGRIGGGSGGVSWGSGTKNRG